MKNTVIVDLDGTLANIDHRLHYVKCEKPDWDVFYAVCDQDAPNQWCVDLINALRGHGINVLIVSARRQTELKKTRKWLSYVFGDKWAPALNLLRPKGNHEEDVVLKKRWLDEFGRDRILFVVDDRQKVVDMWRREGLTCLQCNAWEEYKRP